MKSLLRGLGLTAVLAVLALGPQPAYAQDCASACLGKDAQCLQQCLNGKPVAAKPMTPLGGDGEARPLMLACTQLPVACSSNSDCTCSGCCGDMAGVHICQPNC